MSSLSLAKCMQKGKDLVSLLKSHKGVSEVGRHLAQCLFITLALTLVL